MARVATLLLASLLGALPLDSGWESRWGDLEVTDDGRLASPLPSDGWEGFTVPGWASRAHRGGRTTVWLRARLPANLAAGQVVHLEAVVGHFEAFVGQRRVFQFPPGAGVNGTGVHGLPWHLVELPADAAGQWLSLRVRSEYPASGFQGTPRVGTKDALLVELVERDLARFVLGALMVAVGVLGLFLLRSQARALMLGLVPWALAGGTYTLFYTHLKQLVLPLTSALWFFLWALSVAALGASWLRFLSAAMSTASPGLKRAARTQEGLGLAYVAVSLVAWAVLEFAPSLERVAVMGFFGVGMLVRVSMLVTSTFSLGFLVRLALGKGEAEDVPRAKLMLAGVGVLAFALWLNVLSALGVAPQSRGAWVPWGLLAMTLTLAVLVQRAWNQMRERAVASELELRARAREKEAMLRDLHDGIGSVTTNIRLLAELGRKDAARGERALATIAELSAEGLAELRAFTQTLDEAQPTWPMLVSELRRFGGQLIEAHGKTFELEARLSADAPAPNGVVTLALLRVFREALTNIVKHAQATRVDVRVMATMAQVVLELRDDGQGGGSGGGLDTGRGVRSMRTRAEELGGSLVVTVEPHRQLTVSLPLLARATG
jgi:signal transduction histidine kinase